AFDPGAQLRIDFLIAHPSGLQLVIEIDGDQHRAVRERDLRRDQALLAAGTEVKRIPAREIRAGEGPNLGELAELLSSLPDAPSFSGSSPLQRAFAYSKAAGQFQIALLEGIRAGLLPLETGSNWRLIVLPPTWAEGEIWTRFIIEAAEDFQALTEAICRLHLGFDLNLAVEIYPETQHESHMSVFYGGGHGGIGGASNFFISELYLPATIARTLPSAPSQISINPDKDTVEYLLFHIFQKERFWPGQWDAIERALQGEDSILLLPTGGGKTIAFQLASLLRPGPCLVIDPLIALIEDQLDNLKAIGMDRAIGITSQLAPEERRSALASFAEGQFLFCYVAPERLQMEDFRNSLRAVTAGSPVSLIAIDEAHCVSEWGHDFRTSYLNVGRNAREFCSRDGQVPPLLGLTGTASRSVLKDVQRELD
ncbi:MAG: DEAD/DEAH box helicase, partial [Anaerolineales bacterium]